MNQRYIKIDDKVIVEDENGVIYTTVYNENLDEILEKENLIEELEKQLLKAQSESSAIINVKNNKKIPLKIWLGMTLIPSIFVSSLFFLFPEGEFLCGFLTISTISSALGATIALIAKENYNIAKKQKRE